MISVRCGALRLMAGLLAAGVVCVGVVFVGVAGAAPSASPFAFVPGSVHVTSATGQAAAHADLTVAFDFAHNGAGQTYNDVRTVTVNLPPGYMGNNTAVPTCSIQQLIGRRAAGSAGDPECPVASQVGTLRLECEGCASGGAHLEKVLTPVYNMETSSFGVAGELGFNLAGNVVETQPVSLRPGDSGLTVTTPNIEKIAEAHNITYTTWGLPASTVHDAERGLECYSGFTQECLGGNEPANYPVHPFLANPTSCEAHVASVEAYSWEQPLTPAREETEVTPSGECERVPFDPAIEVEPTTRAAESSSGLDVSLVVPQTWEDPYGLATANLKDSTVILPVGYTANPSLASGLGVCTVGQFESETSSSPAGAGCPSESKIGEVSVETPVLAEKYLTGNIYMAQPYQNPFASLLALYIVVKDPVRGIIVKLAGQIHADATTGQLTTTFDENPQVPFSKFTLKLRQGANSPLVSPPACGEYAAEADLTPWSAPLSPQHLISPPFAVETGVRGGACPSGGTPALAPTAVAGTENNAAGAYSPFYLRISREDGEQELTGFSTIMPAGLTGNLSGIPFCPDSAIEAARARTGPNGGQEELDAPSCPAASKVGHTLVEAGVGTVLAQNPGSLYLAGPFHGAPLSLVSITSAVVGPFDLGNVVIRFALQINPVTAQVEVSPTGSEPIPHIIKGIVTHVRNIRAYLDRPGFIINPTSCERMSIKNVITGAGADPSNPADQMPVSVQSPFQAADCQNLQFKPKFSVTTSGKTSKAQGASLTAKLTYPVAAQGTQANIKEVKVDLPKQLPSRLTTLQKACTAAQFNTNPAGCPAASNIGHAKAITPILPVPLEGPVYFVSHGGEAFPSLEIVLQGYGITIDLVASTFISKAGITSSTFHTVPDQPVTSFEITLPEGKYSALAANGNLCSVTNTVTVKKKVTVRIKGHKQTVTRKVKQTQPASLAMPTAFVAQNGAEIHESTPVTVSGCAKTRPVKKKAKAKKKARKKKS